MARQTTTAPVKGATPPPTENTLATTSASSLPAHMAAYAQAGAGMENIDSGDVETARVVLLQATSKQVTEYDDARAGQWWHSLANIPLGKTLNVVPLYIDKRAILWRDMDDGGGIISRSDDLISWNPPIPDGIRVKINKATREVIWKVPQSVAASRLLEWGTYDPSDPNSQPAATLMYNIVVALLDHPDMPPAVLTMQRSTVRACKKFLGQLRMMRAPIFGTKWQIEPVQDKNKSGQSFFNVKFNGIGFVQDAEQFVLYEGYYKMFKEAGVRIHDLEGAQAEGVADGDAAEPDAGKPAF